MNSNSSKMWAPGTHLTILGAALLLILPAIAAPPMLRDSFWIDWVWSDQFTAELVRGHLYPRWLPLSNGGAGAPTFYFYPPLAFYISGLLGLSGLTTYAAIIGCFGIGLALSGYAMLAWLQGTNRPLFCSLLFMAAPYHLYDFYGRGAQAECLAIALIPLVAVGLRRTSENRPALLVFAYAALILAHLPLALLTSLFLIGPYCFYNGRITRFALPLAAGLALAAIYLVPALALNHYRHSELLWADPQFQPQSWSLIFPRDGPAPGMRKIFAVILFSSLIPIAVLLVVGQRRIALYAAACSILAAGFVPAVWTLPLMRDVQFPFRLLPLIEFAIVTGIASARLSPPTLLLAMSPVLMLTPAFVLARPQEKAPSMERLVSFHPDMPENELIRPGPLPEWPEDIGLVISLVGLLAGAAMYSRERRLRTN